MILQIPACTGMKALFAKNSPTTQLYLRLPIRRSQADTVGVCGERNDNPWMSVCNKRTATFA
jgi:hypothetical protein